MAWFSQNGFEVRLEWDLSAVEHLAGEADSLIAPCSSAIEHRQQGFEENIILCLEADVSTMECLLQGDF